MQCLGITPQMNLMWRLRKCVHLYRADEDVETRERNHDQAFQQMSEFAYTV